MKFRTEIKLDKRPGYFNHGNHLMTIGSCFSTRIGAQLRMSEFNISPDQFGVQFNPLSIEKNIRNAMQGRVEDEHIIERDEHFYHFDFGGQFFAASQPQLKHSIAQIQKTYCRQLAQTDRLIITFGTAWVYRHKELNRIVSNCHKIPQKAFQKELLNLEDLKSLYEKLFEDLKNQQPNLEILLTVSPVRHTKNGLHENNLSKSILLLLTNHLTEKVDFVSYFPAYEIVMDDLRDYRFFQEDLIHPNNQAVAYINNCFEQTYFSPKTLEITSLIRQFQNLNAHKPLAPSAGQEQLRNHQLKDLRTKIDQLKNQF